MLLIVWSMLKELVLFILVSVTEITDNLDYSNILLLHLKYLMTITCPINLILMVLFTEELMKVALFKEFKAYTEILLLKILLDH